MLKRPLAVAVASTEPNRERLRITMAARDAAQRIVSESREIVARLEAAVRSSDDAANTAAKAAHEVNEGRQAWVRGGCKHSGARELQSLADAATEAACTAERAALDAAPVSKELTRVQDVVRSAQIDLRSREAEISAAIGAILVEEAAPLLERFERLAEEYRAVRIEVKALHQFLDPPWDGNAGYASSEGAQVVVSAVERASIKPWAAERQAARDHDFVQATRGSDEARIEHLISPWRVRAAKLREDPDAQI